MSSKGLAKKKSKVDVHLEQDSIVIDEKNGLVFASEDALFKHFESDIKTLENDFFSRRSAEDFTLEEFSEFEDYLGAVLEDPDQILEDKSLIPGQTCYIYVAHFQEKKLGPFQYIAVTYVTGDTPSFVYLHFPTKDENLLNHFVQGNIVYDRILKDVQKGAVEGDALSEGDELAVGLYTSMLKVRTDKDISEEEFHEYVQFREETIEEPDEIWRSPDYAGHVLVTFVREYDDIGAENETTYYIVVTVEDEPSGSHALLFSFPTNDPNLVERYRRCENLQAEEVVQEASH